MADDPRSGSPDFWTVGTTPMLPGEAAEAAAYINARFGEVHAFVADPHDALLMGFDLATARAVRDALEAFRPSSPFNLENLIEEFEAWISARETEGQGGMTGS